MPNVAQMIEEAAARAWERWNEQTRGVSFASAHLPAECKTYPQLYAEELEAQMHILATHINPTEVSENG